MVLTLRSSHIYFFPSQHLHNPSLWDHHLPLPPGPAASEGPCLLLHPRGHLSGLSKDLWNPNKPKPSSDLLFGSPSQTNMATSSERLPASSPFTSCEFHRQGPAPPSKSLPALDAAPWSAASWAQPLTAQIPAARPGNATSGFPLCSSPDSPGERRLPSDIKTHNSYSSPGQQPALSTPSFLGQGHRARPERTQRLCFRRADRMGAGLTAMGAGLTSWAQA